MEALPPAALNGLESAAPEASPDPHRWRTAHGRFVAGGPGGPGRPARSTEADYLRRLSERVTLETWTQIVDRAVADALNGDAAARSWLGAYLLGRPREQGETLSAVQAACAAADAAVDEAFERLLAKKAKAEAAAERRAQPATRLLASAAD